MDRAILRGRRYTNRMYREILRGPTTPQYHGVTKYRVAPTKMLPAIIRGRRRNADRVILRGPCARMAPMPCHARVALKRAPGRPAPRPRLYI